MKITEFIKENILYLDGGMGTLLQEAGLGAGEFPERWNITCADKVTEIHKAYLLAGSNVINTNTFGANRLKFSSAELEMIIKSAVENAKRAVALANREAWVALDIGPTGRMLKPYGDLDFEEAVDIYKEVVNLGTRYGVDLIFIETMSDSYETKAALLAAKEGCDLPVFVSCAYGDDGKLLTGATPAAAVALLEGMGANAIGVNCSRGPAALAPTVEEYLKYASVPVILKANAGLPRVEEGRTVFDISEEDFANETAKLVRKGVRIVGGCCGTTPKYIASLTAKTRDITPVPLSEKNYTAVSSYTHAVIFDEKPVLIGERINPTGKRLFKEALKREDMEYILKEGIKEQDEGADILDVNVGLPEIDETLMLKRAITSLQSVTNLPLQIDTSDPYAMECAARLYNGKPMINSVSGKQESMDAIFPIAKKYGGLVVALTLDEGGIPVKAEERLAVAKKIIAEAEKYGIKKKDLIFDPLALAVSAEKDGARETLRAVRMLRELGVKTSLGVSNVSFGLPERDIINSAFFALALGEGLSAAIMNPYSKEMMKTYRAYLALSGLDNNFEDYISFARSLSEDKEKNGRNTAAASGDEISLTEAIVKGMKETSAKLAVSLLSKKSPLDVISQDIIPALDTVGVGFENKTVYLPQLLMSAECAGAAFEEVKRAFSIGSADKGGVVLATVKGDIHDIGKNIVKLLLENYGFKVYDLGKDTAPEVICEAAVKYGVSLVGLSALMTTTVPSMQKTIEMLRVAAPSCKVVVGGAVLTKEYAESIGADYYAKDAMETVRYAEKIYKQ